MEQSRTATLENSSILRGMLRRRKWLMLGIFFGLSIPLLTAVYLRQEPVYDSTATLMIEPFPAARVPALDLPRGEGLVTAMTLLRSRSLSEAVVQALPKESLDELLTHSQYTDYMLALRNRIRSWLGRPVTVLSPQQRAVEELQNARMEFSQNLRAPQVVTIRGIASQPRVAMDLVNTYIQVLLNRTRSVNQDVARKAQEFLDTQVQQVKDSLGQAEDALTQFQQRRGRIRLPDQAELDLVKLSQTESSLAEAQASREVLTARIARLRKALEQSGPPPDAAAGNAPAVTTESAASVSDTLGKLTAFKQAQDHLAQLEAKLTALRDRYTDAHPLVQTTQQEIATAQALVAKLARELPPVVVRSSRGVPTAPAGPSDRADMQRQLLSLENEDGNLQARIAALQIQVDRMSKNLGGLNQDELKYGNLRRNVDAQRNLLTVLSDKLMAARMLEQGDSNITRIIDSASFPIIPTQSKAKKLAALILALSVGLAVGAGYGIEYYRQPVETEGEIAQFTGLPVLGSVGMIPEGGPARRRRKVRGVPLPVYLPGNQTAGGIHMELYRAIRAAVETERLKAPFHSILVTSPGPGEGKSTTVLNLAYVFQEFGRRVLMIEGDLRRPMLHRTLGIVNKPGLADFLRGTAAFEQICRPLPSGVTLIPGQVVRDDIGSVLSPARVRELLELSRKWFDVVLFDSAPLLAVPDDLLLLSAFDRVMLIARASQTSLRDLQKAQAILERADARVLGIVLNQANRRDVHYYHPRYRKYYPGAETKTAEEGARR